MERELCICQAVNMCQLVTSFIMCISVSAGAQLGHRFSELSLLAVWLQQDSLSSDLLGALIGAVSVLRLAPTGYASS